MTRKKKNLKSQKLKNYIKNEFLYSTDLQKEPSHEAEPLTSGQCLCHLMQDKLVAVPQVRSSEAHCS